jgi:hypothetical protein
MTFSITSNVANHAVIKGSPAIHIHAVQIVKVDRVFHVLNFYSLFNNFYSIDSGYTI